MARQILTYLPHHIHRVHITPELPLLAPSSEDQTRY